jgi:hypothetical protein
MDIPVAIRRQEHRRQANVEVLCQMDITHVVGRCMERTPLQACLKRSM